MSPTTNNTNNELFQSFIEEQMFLIYERAKSLDKEIFNASELFYSFGKGDNSLLEKNYVQYSKKFISPCKWKDLNCEMNLPLFWIEAKNMNWDDEKIIIKIKN